MVFKQELVKDLLGVIVPKVIETIGGIPIGRIEKIDDSYTLVLDNIFLNCVILPKNIKVSTESEVVTNQPVIGKPAGENIRPQATPDLGPVVSATIRVLLRRPRILCSCTIKKAFSIWVMLFWVEETSAKQSQTPPSILRVLKVETSIPDVEINVKKSKHTPDTAPHYQLRRKIRY
ncbi:hypothetical protein BKA69DRAFT_943679 [Paraphysoderma sedebokerense]|nr:hypothetical protein BKA69DRAFT_943679 [Paraphysoderma sedebokerense]